MGRAARRPPHSFVAVWGWQSEGETIRNRMLLRPPDALSRNAVVNLCPRVIGIATKNEAKSQPRKFSLGVAIAPHLSHPKAAAVLSIRHRIIDILRERDDGLQLNARSPPVRPPRNPSSLFLKSHNLQSKSWNKSKKSVKV